MVAGESHSLRKAVPLQKSLGERNSNTPVWSEIIILASLYKRHTIQVFYLQAVSLDWAGFRTILTYIPAICPLLLAVSPGHVFMALLLSWQPPPLLVSFLLSLFFLPATSSWVTENPATFIYCLIIGLRDRKSTRLNSSH